MSKITLVGARDIALDRLVASDANVRRIKAGVSVEDLAEDIARRGLLQSLSVRPVLDAQDQETGRFSVSAGGRRLAALKLLVKQKRLAKNAPVPCIVKTEGIEEEDSLAENTMREALHPLDQFRAFRSLHDHGLSIDDIAARFFVGSQVVRQRLKLAAASQKLLDLYVAEEMTLEQLTAFCVTDDHARQEAVWEALSRSHNTQPYAIRRILTEGAVKPGDKRAIFVGVEAYEAAGGVILRDLFVHDHGGWLQDVALLDRLAREKLNAAVEEIRAEGWKWSEVAIDFPYGHSNGLRRLPANYAPVSEEQQARYDAALAEYSRLSDENEGADELSEEVDERMAELEKEIAAGDERPASYDPAHIARAGVFVSINYAGGLKVERGYVRPEDDASVGSEEGGAAAGSGELLSGSQPATANRATGAATHDAPSSSSPTITEDEAETSPKLSDRMLTELSAHRTVALRSALASDPEAAFLAATHALALSAFYGAVQHSCLDLSERSITLGSHAPGIGDSLAARTVLEILRQLAIATAGQSREPLVLASRSGSKRSGRTLRAMRRALRQRGEPALGKADRSARTRRSSCRATGARYARLLERHHRKLLRQGHQGADSLSGARGEGRGDGGDDRPSEEGGHGLGGGATPARDRVAARGLAHAEPRRPCPGPWSGRASR